MANSRTGIALLLSETMMFFFWGSVCGCFSPVPRMLLTVLSCNSLPQLVWKNRARKHVQTSSEVSGIINGRGMENTSLDKTLLKCSF